MELKLLHKSKDGLKTTFGIKNLDVSYINSLRRIMMSEVPTLAIEEVEFRKNTSLLYDETMAHRLGLVVLSSDLKSYTLPAECTCKGEGCAKCQLKLTLTSAKSGDVVKASIMKSEDPKVIPVHGDTIIVKLSKGQELELEATAILGKGKDHIKWSPGLVYYNYKPKITVNNDTKDFDQFKAKFPPQIFDKSGKIDKNLILDNDLVDACKDVNPNIVKIEYEENSYIFTVEAFGQLTTKEMVKEACSILQQKSDVFVEKLKDLKLD